VNKKVLLAGLVLVVPFLVVLFANLGRDPRSVDSPLIGKPAPPFALAPVSGGDAVSLSGLRGKVVVLNFWATWCVPCMQEHPTLSAGSRSMPDVQFLGVVYQDENAKVAELLRRKPLAYPTLTDEGSKTAIAYGVYGVPETYFIDKQGTIVTKFVGPLDPDTLRALVRQAGGNS
jgi:cytochrome c biogenesis protein CcmG/thiol:disulfide interchange protein DsbE